MSRFWDGQTPGQSRTSHGPGSWSCPDTWVGQTPGQTSHPDLAWPDTWPGQRPARSLPEAPSGVRIRACPGILARHPDSGLTRPGPAPGPGSLDEARIRDLPQDLARPATWPGQGRPRQQPCYSRTLALGGLALGSQPGLANPAS